ncbi:Senescence_reg domain-containing protein [Cephalotus follicularis]|uniref:Senescence_reg domain-containing protein n=1 Tax=Cephalotus follicularis TaxID=3775 RepID=A0A1Q3BYS2_CEPFO|nr:Senescence_reg domain-containing protein [Cephalotus follicularis]
MGDRYGLLNRQGSGVWRSLRDGDFEEEDVWDAFKERKDFVSTFGKFNETPTNVTRKLPSAARMIPRNRSNGPNGSSSSGSSFNEIEGIKQQSAPVNIPDWSKVNGNKSKKAAWLNDDGDGDYDYNDDDDDEVVNDDEDEAEEYGYKMPPHEFIARRLARSHISSFSVFEGAGRTLKGRDLSKRCCIYTGVFDGSFLVLEIVL